MSNSLLSAEELKRYSRHITIPEFGRLGQEKLKKAKVLVVGSGGLGSPLLFYLTAAGVGHIGIVDYDLIEESNLQRQILFTLDDLGKSKAKTAAQRLSKLNPHVKFTVHETALTSDNALEIIKGYDIVADGTDNFPTRYLVNDACLLTDKVNVYASIFQFEGQVSVFNYKNEDGTRGPCYRDMFPEPPPPGLVPNCAEGGVLGVLPGIIGSMQASEVIKVITGVGTPLSRRIFLFDAATFSTRILKVNKSPHTKVDKLIDYQQFCGVSDITDTNVKEISVRELKHLQENGEDFQLIDVRQPYEYEIANLKGELIPLDDILKFSDKIKRDGKVIIHCRSGKRSADAIKELETHFRFENLYNLKGGILAYAEEVDSSLTKY